MAFLSRHLSNHAGRGSHAAVVSLLTSRSISGVITAMAASEMAADKPPIIPSRTNPAPLIGRAALRALSGYTLAEHRAGNKLTGALVGAFAAVGSSFLFSTIRKEVAARTFVPDWIVAGLEDALVLKAGSNLVDRMDE